MVEVLELVLVVVLQIAVDDMILLVDETPLLQSGAMSSTAAQKPGEPDFRYHVELVVVHDDCAPHS